MISGSNNGPESLLCFFGGGGSPTLCRLHQSSMSCLSRLIVVCLFALLQTGCASFLIENQGGNWVGKYKDCPTVFQLTRLEIASLEWAIMDGQIPSDACLRHYYKKAGKDASYMTSNRAMSPLFVLSLPVDLTLDTIVLPFTVSRAITID